jgi:hypothetical protein
LLRLRSYQRNSAAKETELMKLNSLCNSFRVRLVGLAVSLIFACFVEGFVCTRDVLGQVLAYSFETDQGGPDGFQTNTGGTYTQDTIGATLGANSMKVSLLGSPAQPADTFVGAITSIIDPTPDGAVIGDPPGIDHVVFDVTVTEQFVGTFANMGVTVFGCTQAGACGQQQQYFDEENVDLPIGTHRDLRIDLTSSHQTGESFNEAFGEQGSDSRLVPTHFQFFFNKPGTSSLTLYIDNVRVGMTAAGLLGDYNANGTVDAADYVLWRNGGPLANEVADPGTISPEDFGEWRARFGNALPAGSGSQAAVPEPAAALLMVAAGACLLAYRGRVSAR